MRLFSEKLSLFPLPYPIIHVAGTNGKGSVSLKIANSFYYSGYKTGLYTSPHIETFRERIKINEEMIAQEEFAESLAKVFALEDAVKIPLSFFEILTLCAFLYFKEEKIDIAIIEVGMGGKLDATNIVSPILSIITSIGKDHCPILGDTLEKIAKEKAGIIKENTPLILGEKAQIFPILEIAHQKKAPLFFAKASSEPFYDRENSNTALRAIEFLQKDFVLNTVAIQKALATRPEGRLEVLEIEGEKIVLDVAHNPQGLQRLFEALSYFFPEKKIYLLYGASKGKDIEACFEVIEKKASFVYLLSGSHARLLSLPVLEEKAKKYSFPYQAFASVSKSLSSARHFAKKEGLIVYAGTFFLLSQVKEALGLKQPFLSEANYFEQAEMTRQWE